MQLCFSFLYSKWGTFKYQSDIFRYKVIFNKKLKFNLERPLRKVCLLFSSHDKFLQLLAHKDGQCHGLLQQLMTLFFDIKCPNSRTISLRKNLQELRFISGSSSLGAMHGKEHVRVQTPPSEGRYLRMRKS